MPRMVAGSCPVYDCGTSPQGEFNPPGQKVHFPCGHLLGAVMMATGETPEIVRVGLERRTFLNSEISSCGKEIRISILVGVLDNLCFLAMSCLILFRLT